MLIAVLLTCVNAFAHDFEVDGIYYNITSDSDLTVAVTYRGDSYNSYNNEYSGQVTIPESVTYNSNTYSVTSIGGSAFSGCSGLTSVTIGNSVTSIGEAAFSGCSGLTSVTIPNSVTSIGYFAFSGCSGLTNITIPNSVTSIGSSAFNGCSCLTNVTIPNSVTSIGSSAFRGCSGLTSVVFNAENCTTMGSSGYSVFGSCTKLTSITIGDKVKNIPDYAFSDCSGLTSVTIGNSVMSIGESVFYNCSSLATIKIPNSVTSIGSSAFKDCSGLTEVTLGNSVKEIGCGAFYGAKRLGKIYSLNPTPPTCADEDVFYNVNKDKCRVYVPVGAGEDYKTTYVWWDFNNIVEKEMSGVESTLTDNDVNVVVENGNIIVNGAEGANIEVYSTNGQCVYNGTDTGIAVNTKGLYIVKVNGKSFKVIL